MSNEQWATFVRWWQTIEIDNTEDVQQKTLQQIIFCDYQLEDGAWDKEEEQQQRCAVVGQGWLFVVGQDKQGGKQAPRLFWITNQSKISPSNKPTSSLLSLNNLKGVSSCSSKTWKPKKSGKTKLLVTNSKEVANCIIEQQIEQLLQQQ